MKFLEKIRSLPEKKRKIILRLTVGVLSAGLFGWWLVSLPGRFSNFKINSFIEQLDLPEIAVPKMPDLPNLNNIETDAEKATSSQEN